MFEFTYYLVISYYMKDRLAHPYFVTCAKTPKGFVRIQDMEEYIKTGKGLSDEVVDGDFILIKDNDWRTTLRLVKL